MPFAQPRYPKCSILTVEQGDSFGGDNLLSFAPAIAVFVQIDNTGGDVYVQLNGDEEAQFLLPGNQVQIFNNADLHITSLDFAKPFSGEGESVIQVIVGLVAS